MSVNVFRRHNCPLPFQWESTKKTGGDLRIWLAYHVFGPESIILVSFIDETIHNADYMKSYTYCISYLGNWTITEAWKKIISISFISLAQVERHSHTHTLQTITKFRILCKICYLEYNDVKNWSSSVLLYTYFLSIFIFNILLCIYFCIFCI